MALKFTTTAYGGEYVKVLVYGPSGVGKTKLISTAPKPIIISSEKKLISLKDFKIPVILIENFSDLEEAYRFVTTNKKADQFETIAIDSISDIAETILSDYKNDPDTNDHGQAAYGHLADKLGPMIKKFRDIPNKHKYFIAKSKMVEDIYTKMNMFGPSLPGRVLPDNISYEFDYVFAMRVGETESGSKYRYLQTQSDLQWVAKGHDSLKDVERPNLSVIFKKLTADHTKKETAEKPKTEEKTNPVKEVVENGKNAEKEGGEKAQQKAEEKNQEGEKGGKPEVADKDTGPDAGESGEVQDDVSFELAD